MNQFLSAMFASLFLACSLMTPLVIAQPTSISTHQLHQDHDKVDSTLPYLFTLREQQHRHRPILAQILLHQCSPEVMAAIRKTGVEVVNQSQIAPLVTVNLASQQQLKQLSQLPAIEHIASAYQELLPEDPVK